MPNIIKILGSQVALTSTANTVNSGLVYVFNLGTSAATVTQTTAANAAVGSLVVGAGQGIVVEKPITDLLTSNAASGVSATPIAYRS